MRLFAIAALAIAALAYAPAIAQTASLPERDVAAIQACLANTPQETCAGVILNPCAAANDSGSARSQIHCYVRENAAWSALIRARAEQYRAIAPPEAAAELGAYLESAEVNDDARCTIENAEYDEISGLGLGECLNEVLPARDAWLRGLISHQLNLDPQ